MPQTPPMPSVEVAPQAAEYGLTIVKTAREICVFGGAVYKNVKRGRGMNAFIVVLLAAVSAGICAAATLMLKTLHAVCIRDIAEGGRDERLLKRKNRTNSVAAKIAKRAAGALVYIVLFAVCISVVQSASFLICGRLVCNYMPLNVVSDSMDGELPHGADSDAVKGFDADSIIFIENVRGDELEIYDVIAYALSDGTIIVHRIIDVRDGQGETYYITRGDGNAASDPYPVPRSAVIGRYTGFAVPYIGLFVRFMQSAPGIISLVSVAYIAAGGCVVSAKLRKAEKERAAQIGGGEEK